MTSEDFKSLLISASGSQKGFGLIGVLMSIGIVAVLLSLILSFLGSSYSFEAKLRANSLTKKSFGGAEQLLINQRQCRCNLLKGVVGGGGVGFSPTVSSSTVINLSQIKTYADVDGCTNTVGVDTSLSDTTTNSNYYNKASSIAIDQFQIIIPKMLYRASIEITPVWGHSVSFPILMATAPDPHVPSQVVVTICGVDRAS